MFENGTLKFSAEKNIRRFFVAPMVGISHVVFRELIRSYCPMSKTPFLFTEMLSTRRLPSEKLQQISELKTAPGESQLIPQLLGNEEKFIAPSIQKLMPLNPSGFDINMGCPMSHILKHNWGVRLMGDTDYASKVVAMTKKHSPVPVGVKLRASTTAEIEFEKLDLFTQALEDSGADWITIHARTAVQKHAGTARWDIASEIAARRKIPVIVNGDIQTVDDILQLHRSSQCAGIMVARGAIARPWIFWQLAYKLKQTDLIPPLSPVEESKEYCNACLRFLDIGLHYFSYEELLPKFHFFVALSSKWFFFGHSFWKATLKHQSLTELQAVIRHYRDEVHFPMYERIYLT